MANQTATDVLEQELDNMLFRVTQEWDLTAAEIVGVLEKKKFEILFTLMPDAKDDEGDDE